MTAVVHEVSHAGGQETALAELLTGLLARGHEVRVVAARCRLEPHPKLSFVRVPAPRRPASITFPTFFVLGSLAVALRGRGIIHPIGAVVANRADVVTVQFCHAAYKRASFAVRRASRPGRSYLINEWIAEVMSRMAERWTYRASGSRQLVAVSEGVARELQTYFARPDGSVSVIPNGVDLDAFRPDRKARREVRTKEGLGQDELVAVFVGGDWERKGLRYAIEGVARTADWRLVVVGGGDLVPFRRLTAERGVGDRVLFLGPRGNVARHLAAADAFLSPTAYEAFPLAALEAAASGLPLLATRVNGIEDLLVDGVNGWFVDREARSIALRLEHLRSNPDRRAKMSVAARQAALEYGWQRVLAAYLTLYDRTGPSRGTA